MASEYNLKLKAQLDLSDAQSQLDQFRNTSGTTSSGNPITPPINNSINSINSDFNKSMDGFIKTLAKLGGTITLLDQVVTTLDKINSTGNNVNDNFKELSTVLNTAKSSLSGALSGFAIGGPAGAGIGAIVSGLLTVVSKNLEEELKYAAEHSSNLSSLKSTLGNTNQMLNQLSEIEDVNSGTLTSGDLRRRIQTIKNYINALNRQDLNELNAQQLQAAEEELSKETKLLQHSQNLLRIATEREDALLKEEEARQAELDKITESYSIFERNTQFNKSLDITRRLISNNNLDDSMGSITNLLNIFNTLNKEAQDRSLDMKESMESMRYSTTQEEYNRALSDYNTSSRELESIGSLMSSIQGRIANFDKQFSTIQGLQGVKASEISSLAAIGGGGGGSATSGERGMYVEMQRSNQLLDTIDKTIKGLDDFIKSKDFGGGAVFQ